MKSKDIWESVFKWSIWARRAKEMEWDELKLNGIISVEQGVIGINV